MRKSTRRRYGILAMLAYLGLTIGMPVAHAETEVLEAPQSVEAGHSPTCPVIHADAACTGGTVQPLVSRPLMLRAGDRTSAARLPTVSRSGIRVAWDLAHPVRAPPPPRPSR